MKQQDLISCILQKVHYMQHFLLNIMWLLDTLVKLICLLHKLFYSKWNLNLINRIIESCPPPALGKIVKFFYFPIVLPQNRHFCPRRPALLPAPLVPISETCKIGWKFRKTNQTLSDVPINLSLICLFSRVLCLQNILTANVLFFTYTQKHPGIMKREKPYKQPLLNFTAFLLLALEM